jgi:hypothetical protein
LFLQENIVTVKVERVENVGEEDCIKIETEEEFCIQLVRRMKSEEEVSVVCCCFVVVIYLQVVCVCVCVCVCVRVRVRARVCVTLLLVVHFCHLCISHLVNACESAECTCVVFVYDLCFSKLLGTFLSHTHHHQQPSCSVQSVLM